ncbi:MAG: malonyl-ACP O-methyltransferase BioC [Candidatus Omnitrophota bacterium]
MIDKRIIEENFSKHARDYDQHSRVQNLCASRLINEIDSNRYNNILDIGCGTGNYTKLLRDKFPKAKIKAVDISAKMIEVAKEKLGDERIEFIVADAESLNLEEEFDLISSNASFQWFQDLKSDLIRYKQALKRGGFILFSTFGPETFSQLHSCLEEFLGKPLAITASNFLGKEKLEGILKAIFSEVEVKEEVYNQNYNSLLELLENLRCTGTRGDGLKGEIFWTPQKVASIEEIYKKKFPAPAKGWSQPEAGQPLTEDSGRKNIVATYQIFFCRGTK